MYSIMQCRIESGQGAFWLGQSAEGRQAEASTSFLKKRSKKLLFPRGGWLDDRALAILR
jgi:hypothetical protein